VIAVSDGGSGGANVVIAIDDERCNDGTPCGRAVATPCLHQFADSRLDVGTGESSEIFKDFARNIARWLATR
jgi:hypothetical protein